MTITDIAIISNDYTDENFSDALVRSFADNAISRINVEIKTKLPSYAIEGEYIALSDDWQRLIVIPFVCWSIKMNDSSLNEADVYWGQFSQGMELIKKNKRTAVSEEYRQDGFSNVYQIKQYRGMR